VGFISWVLLHVVTGRGRSIHPLMWVVAVLFVLYFAEKPITSLLGLS
jgi:adenine/guanine/hypoxanthine permease